MFRTSTIAAGLLALSATAAMAQSTVSVPDRKGSVLLQYDRQQAMTPVTEDHSNRTFIKDEYGNLYDGRGQQITPRPVKLNH